MKSAPTITKRKLRRYDWEAYAMLAPGYLVYFIFIMIPVFIGLYYSFTKYSFFGKPVFIGLRNYVLLTKDPVFVKAMVNTIVYTLSTVLPQMVFGLLFASVLNQNMRGEKVFRSMIYIPNVTSMVAVSMIWLWIYDPTTGMLNGLLNMVGVPGKQWLFDTHTAMPSIIVMGIWKVVGYNMVIYLAALQTIPASLYEVAEIDGAGSIRKFFAVTLPLLKPTTFFLLVMNTIASFRVFEQVTIMTGGGPLNATTTLVHQIYIRGFEEFNMGYASAMAVILLIVTATSTFLNFKIGGDQADVD